MPPATTPPHILLAEDELAIRRFITYRLERAGYTVTAVGDGAAALRAIADERPDLAVLDIRMPEADGLEVTRRLRAQPSTRDLPVILLTGCSTESDLERGFAAGADDYLRKPFSPVELRVRVAAALRRR